MFGRPVVDGPPKLRECDACGYALCICPVLGHAEACAFRRTVLNPHPTECAPHQVVACATCNPCDCGVVAAAPATKKKRRAA